jgi:hypothetical protein
MSALFTTSTLSVQRVRRLGSVLAVGAIAVALGACSPKAVTPKPTPTPSPRVKPSGPVFDVSTFGASGDGKADSTKAIQAAIDAASAHGGTVYFPAGRFMVGDNGSGASIKVVSGAAVALRGASRDSSSLVEKLPGRDLLSVRVDGTVVENLTLDTRSGDGRAAIVVVANNTTLQQSQVLGGSRIFALFYAGPKGATPDQPLYNHGNQVLDTKVEDDINDDGFSWSFQENSRISNIDHTGSRLAIYVDRYLEVDGYRYTPGSQRAGKNGFWITAPSSHVTIKGFVSSGSGGIVGSNPSRTSSDILIDGEQMLAPGAFDIKIGDVSNLTIQNCTLAAGNSLAFITKVKADHVVVRHCTLGMVRLRQTPPAVISALDFIGDSFPPANPPPGGDTATFVNLHGAPVTLTVDGDRWDNRAGGFVSGSGINFTVHNLAGYP